MYPVVSLAQAVDDFDYELILSDLEFLAYESMDQMEIQQFLEKKGSFLSHYVKQLDTGERVLASDLIFRASRNHRVSPKFLLALLQKEQSLVEEATPKTTQLDWATGYGCLDGQPCNERWRGFHKQINSAAEQFRYYYDHINEYNFRPGKASNIDDRIIIPRNITTAALYNYTPHLHGNKLMKDIWLRYFATQLPDGTLVKVVDNPDVWLLENGKKRHIISELALVSRYNPALIVDIAQADLDTYERGPVIEFAAYSLLRGNPSGNIYLLTIDKKRLITSMDVFRTIGFNPEEIEEVSDEQLMLIPDGKEITLGDTFPTGALLEDNVSTDLYYVEAGRKYPVQAQAIADVNFPNMPITSVDAEALQKYASGFPVMFKEGTLVKGSDPMVFVISNKKKRHITSEEIFSRIGYQWTNIIFTTDKALDLHPTGDPVILNN